MHVRVCVLPPRVHSSCDSLGSTLFRRARTCSAFQLHTPLWMEPDPSACRSYPLRSWGFSFPREISVSEWTSEPSEMLRFVYWEIWQQCCCLNFQVLWPGVTVCTCMAMIYPFSLCKGLACVLFLNFVFNKKKSSFGADLLGEGDNKIYLTYFIIKILLLLLNFQKLKHTYVESYALTTLLQGLFVCLLNNSCVFPELIPSPHSSQSLWPFTEKWQEPFSMDLTTAFVRDIS